MLIPLADDGHQGNQKNHRNQRTKRNEKVRKAFSVCLEGKEVQLGESPEALIMGEELSGVHSFDRYNIVFQEDLKYAALKRQEFSTKQAEQL